MKIVIQESNEQIFKRVLEGGTSRLYNHITNDTDWAIVSAFRSEHSYADNLKLHNELKNYCKNKYGFIEFVSRWVEDGESFDERSVFIPGIQEDEAIVLGKKYDQSSVIVKSGDSCKEVCVIPFENYSVGNVVRTYNIGNSNILNINFAKDIFSKRVGGPASKPVKGTRPFTLKELSEVFEVVQPQPSYFQSKERIIRIY